MNEEQKDFDYVGFCNTAWDQSTDAWKNRKLAFDESWNLFWNKYDFSRKASWQSKNFVPKMSRMIRQAAYSFKDAIITAGDFFSVIGVGVKSKERAWVPAKIIMFWARKNDLVNKIVDSLFAALMSSMMVFKVYWETYSDTDVTEPTSINPNSAKGLESSLALTDAPAGATPPPLTTKRIVKGRMRVDIIDPYNFRVDPTGARKYVIHEYEMDLHDLIQLASSPANKYEKDVVDQMCADIRNASEKQADEARRKNESVPQGQQSKRKRIRIREYWGELYDEDGKDLRRNMTFSIANDTYLIRKPFKNPYFPDHDPFVYGPLLRVPFSNFHQSFAEVLNGLQRIATEIYNLTLDSNLWSSMKAFEIDLDQVVDANELKNGVYPGKAFKKRTKGVPRQMITAIELGMTNPQNLAFYNQVDREMQNVSSITEFSAGFVGGRKTELATEINTKSAQSFTYMGSIAREAEDNVLSRLIDYMWECVLNFQDDYTDEEIKELLGEDTSNLLALMSDSGRRDYLGGRYRFEFNGISRVLDKAKELEKVQLTIQLLERVPGAVDALNKPAMLRKFFDSLNWNPEELIAKEFLVAGAKATPSVPTPGAVPMPTADGANLLSALSKGGAYA
jgi:hypothetical protein